MSGNGTVRTSGNDPPQAPLAWFSRMLRDLQSASGSPSLNDLVRLTKEIGQPYTRSTIQAKLAGTSTADWEFVKAFVTACHHNAGSPGGPALDSWRESHQRMMRELAELRRGQRRAHDAATKLAVPKQLPAASRHFADRVHELGELTGLLKGAAGAGNTVVISAIGGSAGIGKTALAVYWAHQVIRRFPDGQLYVNLRGFDPSGLAMTPAEALRSFLYALQVPIERIPSSVDAQSGLYRSLLSGRRMLILLDNARDYAQIRPLIPGEAKCLTLVTSRNQFTGLIATEGARPLTLDLLTADEAYELLASRLGEDRVAAEPEAVSKIITMCAQLPLALAIVAARASLLPGFPLLRLAEQLSSMRNRLDPFEGGDLAVRATFSWSYEQLSNDAARLFRLLGLHPGPDITVPAAASLASVDTPDAVTALTELTRAHLVEEYSPGRFTFHDLLRAYATELTQTLDVEPQRQDATYRMLDHYLQTARVADLLLNPNRDPITVPPAIAGVTAEELTNLDEAMAWFTTERQVLLAALRQDIGDAFDRYKWQLAWTLADFFERQGYWQDQAIAQETALAAARRSGDKEGQARAHGALGPGNARLGLYEDALAHLLHARDLYGELGDHTGQAAMDLDLTNVLELQGRHDEALGHAREALDIFRTTSHPYGQAHALNAIGWCQAMLGDYEGTIASCDQALSLFQEVGDLYGQAATLDSLGYGHHNLGQYNAAIECYTKAITTWHDVGDRYHEADTFAHLGDSHHAAGDIASARNAWQQAIMILDELGHAEADQIRAKLNSITKVE